MKKLLTLFTLLLLFCGAGFYWFSTLRLEQQLERFAAQVSPIGQLGWSSVIIDPRGRAHVNNLSFRPHQGSDSIRVDHLVLQTSSLSRLLDIAPTLGRGEAPSRATIRIEGMRLPMNPAFADWRVEKIGLLLPLRASGCDTFEKMKVEQLLDLGYGRLQIDANLDWTLINDRLSINLTLHADQVSETRYRVELELAQADRRLENLFSVPQSAHLIDLDYQFMDRGLAKRIDERCFGPTPESRDAHLAGWMGAWSDYSMEPSGLVVAGYLHFLEQAQNSITISARPAEPLPLGRFAVDPPQRLIQDLNPMFSINQGPTVDLTTRSVRSTRVEPEKDDDTDDQQQLAIRRATDLTETQIVVGRAPDWQLISVDVVNEHIGDQARIELSDGSKLRGRIAGIDGEQIQLQVRSLQGEFTRPFLLERVKTIEVRP